MRSKHSQCNLFDRDQMSTGNNSNIGKVVLNSLIFTNIYLQKLIFHTTLPVKTNVTQSSEMANSHLSFQFCISLSAIAA